jgi:hypothetical protein
MAFQKIASKSLMYENGCIHYISSCSLLLNRYKFCIYMHTMCWAYHPLIIVQKFHEPSSLSNIYISTCHVNNLTKWHIYETCTWPWTHNNLHLPKTCKNFWEYHAIVWELDNMVWCNVESDFFQFLKVLNVCDQVHLRVTYHGPQYVLLFKLIFQWFGFLPNVNNDFYLKFGVWKKSLSIWQMKMDLIK